MMRLKIITLSLVLLSSMSVSGQSFLDHLQKENQGQGQGSVSVKQSDDISNLVNGKSKQKESTASQKSESRSGSSSSQTTATSTPRTENRTASRESSTTSTSSSSSSTSGLDQSIKNEREKERARQRREDEKLKQEAHKEAMNTRDYSSSTTSSYGTGKKVMRGGRRIDGYMVQVWSGGNTREDKLKAEQVGQEMKSQMPNMPVYVHFYSPRWACRIGNFRKQDDATALVKKLKKLGYRSACVVKASLITRTYK